VDFAKSHCEKSDEYAEVTGRVKDLAPRVDLPVPGAGNDTLRFGRIFSPQGLPLVLGVVVT